MLKLFEKKFNTDLKSNKESKDKSDNTSEVMKTKLPEIKKGTHILQLSQNDMESNNTNDKALKTNGSGKFKSSLKTLNSYLLGNLLIVYKNNKSKLYIFNLFLFTLFYFILF